MAPILLARITSDKQATQLVNTDSLLVALDSATAGLLGAAGHVCRQLYAYLPAQGWQPLHERLYGQLKGHAPEDWMHFLVHEFQEHYALGLALEAAVKAAAAPRVMLHMAQDDPYLPLLQRILTLMDVPYEVSHA